MNIDSEFYTDKTWMPRVNHFIRAGTKEDVY